MLKRIDPASAESIHANNVKRVIRAIEYNHQTGQLISQHNKEEKLTIINHILDLYKATLYRQTMFAEFEKNMYEKRKKESRFSLTPLGIYPEN